MPPKRTRELTLSVSYDFQLPSFYEMSDPEATSEAIRMGAYTYQSIKTLRIDNELKSMSEARNAEISTIQGNYQQQAAQMETEHAELLKTSLEQQRLLVIEPMRSTNEARTFAMELRLSNLDERRRTLDKIHMSDIAAAEQKAKDQCEERIARLTADNEQLKTYFSSQSEQLTALSEFVRRAVPTIQKTRVAFIDMFRDELMTTYNSDNRYSIVNVEFGTSKGYLMMDGMRQVLWDLRVLNRTVIAEDIDDFIKNVKNNGEHPIGVLVSGYSDIRGKNSTGDRCVEFQDGMMLVYLSRFESMAGDRLRSLMLLFQLWWQTGRNIEENKALIRTIEELHTKAERSRREWNTHKTRMDDTARWMTTVIEENETNLKRVLEQANAIVMPKATGESFELSSK
jgi:hypothetical protein